jgi:tripartite-type tricarboxylate transporter receptor subunit TctC
VVDKVIDSTVNNPIEAVAQRKDGALRPIFVFDSIQLQQTEKIAGGVSWSEFPTCKSQGIDVEYLMLRGVFTTPGAAPDQVAYDIDVLKKVRETRTHPARFACDKISHRACASVLWKVRKFFVVSTRALLQRSAANLLPLLCNTL